MSKTLPFRKSNTPAEISRPMICFWYETTSTTSRVVV